MQLLAAALLFSTGGAAIKAVTLTSWQVAGFRSAIAAVVLLALLPEARRNWSKRTGLVSIAYAATLVLFVLANKLTTAANAIFLQASAPVYLVLLGPWLLKEKPQRRDWWTLAVIGCGMALFFAGAEAPRITAPDPRGGNLLAAGAGLSWALTLGGLRWIAGKSGDQDGGLATVAGGNCLAALVCLPMALPVTASTSLDWLVVSYLGIFQIGLAYLLLTRGVRGVPALEVSLLIMLEPALNPVWTWLVHGEAPGCYSIGGGALILAATVWRGITARR